LLEQEFGRTAIKEMMPMQPRRCTRDLLPMSKTSPAILDLGPQTTIEEGIKKFAKWYRDYHKS